MAIWKNKTSSLPLQPRLEELEESTKASGHGELALHPQKMFTINVLRSKEKAGTLETGIDDVLQNSGCKFSFVVTAEEALLLWKNGCFGSASPRDAPPRLLFGTLSLAEAVYLCHTNQAVVLDSQGDITTASDLLSLSRNQESLSAVIVYCRLRSLGWIVRSGLNYGVHYLLYKNHPDEEHAPIAVYVDEYHSILHQSSLTWRSVLGVNRVASGAKKQLILARCILERDDASLDLLDDPEIVQFLSISRWAPDADRSKRPCRRTL